MNTEITVESNRSRDLSLTPEDVAFVRLAAAIVESPEEVILASLLAARAKNSNIAVN